MVNTNVLRQKIMASEVLFFMFRWTSKKNVAGYHTSDSASSSSHCFQNMLTLRVLIEISSKVANATFCITCALTSLNQTMFNSPTGTTKQQVHVNARMVMMMMMIIII